MSAAPPTQSGTASGILNMTRGLGTTLGLSLTALILATQAGTHPHPAHLDHAFRTANWFLATTALAAAAITGRRGTAARRGTR